MTTGAESATADPFADVFSREDRDRGADAAAPEAKEGPVRDEQGRFAPKAEPEAKAEAPKQEQPKVSPEPEAEDADRRVPLRELLAERQKRREAEKSVREESDRRFQEYERQLQELKSRLSQPQPQREPPPDPTIDPQGAYQHLQQQFQYQLLNERANFSEMRARSAFGDEAVDKALKAAPPEMRQRFMHEPDPYSALIRWHQQTSFLSEVGPDPAKWKQSYEAEVEKRVREKVLAELKTGGAAPPVKHPGSLASATMTGEQGQHLNIEAIADQIFDSGRDRKR